MKKLIMLLVSFAVGVNTAYAAFNPSTLNNKPVSASVAPNQAVVDINHANAEELMSLKGIGEKKAQAIIAYRTQHGAFKSVSELTAIKGFSEKQLGVFLKNNEGRVVTK
ncbi:MAG TPA: helix-hairpin-helix domain-containing protein [Coxiellaceae bacterium]|nr:helix-hairpin-helix domain-containing protein [Coxiellaceae bacterium]